MSLSLLPAGTLPQARTILASRALRSLLDGCICVVLPAYLLALGLAPWQIGMIGTATLLGSALMTAALGAFAHRFAQHRLLLASCVLMAATGAAFASSSVFWLLLLIAFVGTLNPSSGDVSIFLPLEHSRLAACADENGRATLFARYSIASALFAALGSLVAVLPDAFITRWDFAPLPTLRGVFLVYAVCGFFLFWLYAHSRFPQEESQAAEPTRTAAAASNAAPLTVSRSVVLKLALLFALDAFGGGLVINSLLALWLLQRFAMPLAEAGAFFFCAGLLTALSQFLSPIIARRLGLVKTMVLTHIPANACLIGAALAGSLHAALAFLLLRALLTQMDVPLRNSLVMSLVTPAERTSAASFTLLPRSLASAASPTLAGALFTWGWMALPLVLAGVLKIVYDLLLLGAFGRGKVRGE